MTDFYSKCASQCAALYATLSPGQTYAKWLDLIPAARSRVLDVGAGSGRDAAWLASLGHAVVAAEPSEAMREKARELHPCPSVRWIIDALPELEKVRALNTPFAFILANAVWIHVRPQDRARAMARLASLLEERGVLVVTLRHGPSPDARVMHACADEELEGLARSQGLETLLRDVMPDALGRPEVSWTHMAFTPRGRNDPRQEDARLE